MNILDKKLKRLTRWVSVSERPEPLELNHEAQEDIAWAADEIRRLHEAIDKALQQQPYAATKAAKIFNELRQAIDANADRLWLPVN